MELRFRLPRSAVKKLDKSSLLSFLHTSQTADNLERAPSSCAKMCLRMVQTPVLPLNSPLPYFSWFSFSMYVLYTHDNTIPATSCHAPIHATENRKTKESIEKQTTLRRFRSLQAGHIKVPIRGGVTSSGSPKGSCKATVRSTTRCSHNLLEPGLLTLKFRQVSRESLTSR